MGVAADGVVVAVLRYESRMIGRNEVWYGIQGMHAFLDPAEDEGGRADNQVPWVYEPLEITSYF